MFEPTVLNFVQYKSFAYFDLYGGFLLQLQYFFILKVQLLFSPCENDENKKD